MSTSETVFLLNAFFSVLAQLATIKGCKPSVGRLCVEWYLRFARHGALGAGAVPNTHCCNFGVQGIPTFACFVGMAISYPMLASLASFTFRNL